MFLRTYRLVVVSAAVILLARAADAPAAEPTAIFHVGNSLTDQAYGMHDIAKARGHETRFGRHMIPGAPLEWLWNHRGEGFREPGGKPADETLKSNKWDALNPVRHDSCFVRPGWPDDKKRDSCGLARNLRPAHDGSGDCRSDRAPPCRTRNGKTFANRTSKA